METKEGFMSNIENQDFSDIYQVTTSAKIIKSIVSYFKKDGVVCLSSYTGYTESYHSYWKVKNHDKAVNLLIRAQKDFINSNRSQSAPLLYSMENRYKNYFLEEINDYIPIWDRHEIGVINEK